MDKIAVLIPCYNESRTIEKVVTDFKRVLPEATIYVYDNNSTDGTDELARGAGATVRYEYRQGKGNVLRRMFRDIDAECYIITDGDDTYPAESAREMADQVLERRVDMVVGDRLSSTYFTENKRPFHNFGNSLVRKSINTLFKNDIKDIMTGYRAFSYEFVKTFPVLSKGFEIETEMILVDQFFLRRSPVHARSDEDGNVDIRVPLAQFCQELGHDDVARYRAGMVTGNNDAVLLPLGQFAQFRAANRVGQGIGDEFRFRFRRLVFMGVGDEDAGDLFFRQFEFDFFFAKGQAKCMHRCTSFLSSLLYICL